jgi:hypothetical protein
MTSQFYNSKAGFSQIGHQVVQGLSAGKNLFAALLDT